MFRNHFKLAWRNLLKDRLFSILNLIGLSTGLASAIGIYLWVSHEMNVNKFTNHDDRIFQVVQTVSNSNAANESTPGLLAEALRKELPEVEYSSSVIPSNGFSDKGLAVFNETHIRAAAQFVSEGFLNIFPLSFIEGDANRIFTDKNGIVLSRDLAMKLFGRVDNVVGKTIEWRQENFDGNYIVTAVFEKLPSNSTLQFDLLFDYALFLEKNPKLLKWTNNDPSTYVLLKPGASATEFNKKVSSFIKTKNPDSKAILFAQAFQDTYLYNKYENGIPSGGRINDVRLFSILAIVILVIACINFMNLSTAKALKRVKEVGIQRIVGANRISLVFRYLSESLLLTFLATLLAVGLVTLFLPVFKSIAGVDLSLSFNINFIFKLLLVAFITGLAAGSYPALYLSGFKPALVVKGKLTSGSGELWMRKGLVIFQFTISVLMIVTVITVYKQMRLIQTIDLGYDKEQVIYFNKGGKESKSYDLEVFLQQLKAIPGVANVSNFRHSIVNREGGTTDLQWEGKSPNDQTSFTDIASGYNFIETLGIQMKEGRSYSKVFGSDNDNVVLNEAAVNAMGLRDPVGKTITIWGNNKKIIGVTKDFHFQSLYENIKPCFFDLSMNSRVSKIIMRVEGKNIKATIDRIAEFYKSYNGEALDYKFLDEDYQTLYVSENRIAALTKYFASIAIIISCLGLFGLTAFTAQKRKKEIGIRKVVGASVTSITTMLSKDFLKLILLSCVIAFPIAWSILSKWLEAFAYRVNITPGVFVIAGLSVIVLTLLTISFQALKAALTNPITSLRSE